jgi:hypothetical protein
LAGDITPAQVGHLILNPGSTLDIDVSSTSHDSITVMDDGYTVLDGNIFITIFTNAYIHE